MADPTVEQEVKKQFDDAVARMPFLLRYTTGEITSLDEVSTDEHMHGLQLVIFELARITERLAREIDQLKASQSR